MLDRVLSIDEVGSFAAVPLGQIAAGILIETSSAGSTYLAAGLGVVIASAVSFLLKDMRRLSYHES